MCPFFCGGKLWTNNYLSVSYGISWSDSRILLPFHLKSTRICHMWPLVDKPHTMTECSYKACLYLPNGIWLTYRAVSFILQSFLACCKNVIFRSWKFCEALKIEYRMSKHFITLCKLNLQSSKKQSSSVYFKNIKVIRHKFSYGKLFFLSSLTYQDDWQGYINTYNV